MDPALQLGFKQELVVGALGMNVLRLCAGMDPALQLGFKQEPLLLPANSCRLACYTNAWFPAIKRLSYEELPT